MSTLNFTTVGGWAVVLAAAGGLYYISGRKERSRRPPISKQTTKHADAKKETKGKKGKKAVVQSDGESEIKSGAEKKQKKKTPAAAANREEPVSTLVSTKNDKDQEADDREFARQMAKAKTGAIAAPKSKGESRQKSVKQNKAQEKLAVETSSDNLTAPSSANGGDADDDQSSINSPDLNATTIESPVTNGGISDMLEKPAPGPSVLNITAPTQPASTQKPKQQATMAPAETKKQRQNRQKAEAKKVARQEEEAERQKLLEQQRRTARLAEGRAAKDGSTFIASEAPASSSWTSPPAVNGNAASSSKSNNVDLLDTIEDPTKKPVSPSPSAPSEPVYSESQEFGSKWQTSLSEEEQIRILKEDDNENWVTVKNKMEKKRKANKENRSPKDDSSADEQKDFGVPPLITPTGPGQKWTTTLAYVDDTGEVVEKEVELQDSEWVVS